MMKRLDLANALHAYCARDTQGMLELRHVLMRKAVWPRSHPQNCLSPN